MTTNIRDEIRAKVAQIRSEFRYIELAPKYGYRAPACWLVGPRIDLAHLFPRRNEGR